MSAWSSVVEFLAKAFSEDGQPSSSRIISAWLSVSSMALIWWMARHAMSQPVDKLQVWIGGLPMIIGALATFAASPYGISKITGIFNKAGNKIVEEEKPANK
jgi:hypothetical protein